MKKFMQNHWSRRIAQVTILSFVALLWPFTDHSSEVWRLQLQGRAEAADGEVHSVYLLPLGNQTGEAGVEQRIEAALRTEMQQSRVIELLNLSLVPVSPERSEPVSPVIRRALQERGPDGQPIITPEEVQNPPVIDFAADQATQEQQLRAAVDFARRLQVDRVLVGQVKRYQLTDDPRQLDLRLDLLEYVVPRTETEVFDPTDTAKHKLHVIGHLEPGRRFGRLLGVQELETLAFERLAKKVIASLSGFREKPEKPERPPKKKQNILTYAAIVVGILAVMNLTKKGGRGPSGPVVEATSVRAVATRSNVTVTWAPIGADRASGYNIYRRIVSQRQLKSRQAEDYVKIAYVPGGDSSQFVDTSARTGFEYAYQVAAVAPNGTEGPHVPESGVSAGPSLAAPPLQLQGQAGDGFVRLSWVPSGADFVDGYNLYRRTQGGVDQLIATLPSTATEYTDTNVTNNVTYIYTLVAFANVEEGSRAILEGDPASVTVRPAEKIPEAPRGLTAEVQDAQVLLQWQASVEADVVSYNIYRREGTGRGLRDAGGRVDIHGFKWGRPGRARGDFRQAAAQLIGTVPVTTPTFLDRTVTPNVSYVYYVTAVDRAGNESAPSNEVAVTPNAPPPPPQGVEAQGGDKQVQITWLRLEAVPDLAGYNVYRSPRPITALHPRDATGVTQLNLTLLSPIQTSYVDSGLVNNTTFYYAVTAVDSFGAESNFSLVRQATPHLPPVAIRLSATPRTISANGLSTSTVTATVTDANGHATGGVRVNFTTTEGFLFEGTTVPKPGTVGARTLTAQTDALGQAQALLQSTPSQATDLSALVTATAPEIASGRNSDTAVVLMRASRAASISVTASPATLVADRASTATITARVLDALNNPVADGTEVEFSLASTDQGALAAGGTSPIEGQITATDLTINGEAQALYRAGAKAGTVVITATVRAAGVSGSTAVILKVGAAARIKSLKADPVTLPAGGGRTATITAEVTDAEGNPVANGTVVNFTTTLGTIGKSATTTNGIATTVLTPGQEIGTAIIVASVGGVSRQTQVTITAGDAMQIRLSAEPQSVPADGASTVAIVAVVMDAGGNAVKENTPVAFSTTLGTITPSDATDANGRAEATLRASTQAGTATVTVSAGGTSASMAIEFLAGSAASLTLSAADENLPADGASTTQIQALVEDANGNPVADGTKVNFQVLSGDARITDSAATVNGVATAILTAGTTVGTAQIQATTAGPEGPISADTPLPVRLTPPVPGSIDLTVEPQTISVSRIAPNGARTPLNPLLVNQTEVRAVARDTNGRVLRGTELFLSCTDGETVFSDGVSQFPSPLTVRTGTDGIARIGGEGGPLPKLVASSKAGVLTITVADKNGRVTDSATVTVVPGPPAQIKLQANPKEISRNGSATSTLTAEVKDENNNPVRDGTQIVFSTTAGTINTPVQTTAGGLATALLTSDTTSAEATVTAVAGEVSDQTTILFSSILPELASVVVNPALLAGDGIQQAQITATVTNANGVAVPDGTVVEFSTVKAGTTTPGAGRILNPTSTVNGVATATLQSTIVTQREDIEVLARVGGVVLGRARVTFTGGRGDITLIAAPSVLVADGVSQATITAVVTDANGNPKPNQNVVFLTTAGSIVTTQPVTDQFGAARATLTSSPTVGEVTVTAASGSLQRDISVFFQAGPAQVLTLAATPLTPLKADGNETFTLVAEVLDAFGNPVDEGTTVTFTATDAQGNPTGTFSPATSATVRHVERAGKTVAQATVFLSNTVKGDVTVTAAVPGTPATDSAQVRFTAGDPSRVVLTVNPASIEANGTSTASVRAEVYDVNGNLVGDGTRVTFSTTKGTVEADRPLPGSLNTGETRNGVVTATLRSGTDSGTVTIRATVPPAGPAGEVTMIFTPTTNLTIRISASPLAIPADGASTSTIRVTLTDANTNQPVAAGTPITLVTTLGTIPPSAQTDANGLALDPATNAPPLLTSAVTAGVATVTASAAGAAARTVQVTFQPGTAASIALSSNKANITADGSDNATITAELQDANGNAVPGVVVQFSSAFANLRINGQDTSGANPPVSATTDSTGKATVTVTGTSTGTAIINATDGTIAGTVQLNLEPGPATQVTVVANPASIRADGISTSRISATVRDAFGNLVANGTLVRFATSAGAIKADQPQGGDNQLGRTVNGVATATLTSSTAANTTATITAQTELTKALGTSQVTFTPGPAAAVDVTADPEAISITFTGQTPNAATITAVVRDSTGQPVANGTQVAFATTLGTITPATGSTVNGIVKARLESGTIAGTATATASALDAQGNTLVTEAVEVEFIPGPPASLTLTANPSNIVADGKSTSTITAVVRDQEGNNVTDGTVVTITTSGGSLPTIPPDEPDLDPATNGYQVKTVNGVATATLTSSTKAGREVIAATAGTVGASKEVTFSGDVPANITIGFNLFGNDITYTPSIWANNGGTSGSVTVNVQVTTKNGDPVSDGTMVKFRILDKATGLTDGRVQPGTTQTVNGRVTTTVYSSDHAGVHLIRAEVYDGEGNVVLSAERDIYFAGNVHQITLETTYNAFGDIPPGSGNPSIGAGLRFRSSYVVGVGEIYPHGDPDMADDNGYYADPPGDYFLARAQVLEQNALPVPDGTQVDFWITEDAQGHARDYHTDPDVGFTTNGWTTLPPGWTVEVSGGSAGDRYRLWAGVVSSIGVPDVTQTYQWVSVF